MASTEKLVSIRLKLIDEMSSELGKAGNSLKSLSSTLTSIGVGMTAAITAPLVAAGVAAVNLSMDFDRSMRNIQSISGQTDAEIAALGQRFKDMSMDMSITTDSAQNLSEAFYQIQSSGFAGEDAMLVLEASTKAATAGLTTTAVAAEAVVGVLNAYGLSAEHATEITDIMFQTVNKGVVNFEQLSGSLGTVIGLAAQLGVEFYEVGAAMATMTKQGVSPDEAMTNLNAIFTAMISPTEAMSQAIRDLGYESGSAMLETLGLGGTMQALEEYTGGNVEQMQSLMGNVRALRGAMSLTGAGAQMFADDLIAMGQASGATQAAFDIQMKAFAAAWQNFQNTAGVALMEAGAIILPFFAQLLTAVSGLLTWWIKLDDTSQTFVIILLAILAAIGPILLIFGQIVGLMAALSTISVAAGAGIAAVAAPILMVSGLIVGLIALIVLLIANWDALGTTVSQLGALLAQAWGEMIDKAGTAAAQLVTIIGTTIGRLAVIGMAIGAAIIKGMIKGILSAALELIRIVLDISNQIINAVKSALGIASPSKVFEGLGKQTVEGYQEGIEGMGGVGVNVNGANLTGGRPSLSPAFAGGGAGNGGGNTYNTNYFQLPVGTTDEQVREISKKLASMTARKGGNRTKR